MRKFVVLLAIMLFTFVPVCSSATVDYIDYFIDQSTIICFAVFSGNFQTNTCVPCDKIPLRRLLILKEKGWSPLRDMTPEERETYRKRIFEKYGGVTE
jgi:hypothetical protein